MGEERERVCMCVPYLLIKIEIRTQYTLSLSFSLKTNLLTQSKNQVEKKIFNCHRHQMKFH